MTRTEREILRPLAARCVRVAGGGDADGLEFGFSTVVLGVAGGFVNYDGFITRVRASCEFGYASVFEEVGFDVIVDVDDRWHGTVGPCTRWRALMIAAASVAMVVGVWLLTVVSSTHDYPLPPTSTFGTLGIEPTLVHR